MTTSLATKFGPQPLRFYECGCCEYLHPVAWDGDCRDDANRFSLDQLDDKYGYDGWEELFPGDSDSPYEFYYEEGEE